MSGRPFTVFAICAAIAGYAATCLVNPGIGLPSHISPFVLVFFGLAAVVVPGVISVRSTGK